MKSNKIIKYKFKILHKIEIYHSMTYKETMLKISIKIISNMFKISTINNMFSKIIKICKLIIKIKLQISKIKNIINSLGKVILKMFNKSKIVMKKKDILLNH